MRHEPTSDNPSDPRFVDQLSDDLLIAVLGGCGWVVREEHDAWFGYPPHDIIQRRPRMPWEARTWLRNAARRDASIAERVRAALGGSLDG